MATIDTASCDYAIKQVKSRKSRYCTFRVRHDNNSIRVVADIISAPNDTYNILINSLGDTQPSYILYDYTCKQNDGRISETIYLIYYCPDNTSQNDRLLYASSKGTLVNHLSGIRLIDVSEPDDIVELLHHELACSK